MGPNYTSITSNTSQFPSSRQLLELAVGGQRRPTDQSRKWLWRAHYDHVDFCFIIAWRLLLVSFLSHYRNAME